MRQAIAEVLPELRPLRSSPLQIPAVISVVLVSLGWLLLISGIAAMASMILGYLVVSARRRRAEMALRDLESRTDMVRAFIASLGIASDGMIYAKDARGRIIFSNKSAAEVHGPSWLPDGGSGYMEPLTERDERVLRKERDLPYEWSTLDGQALPVWFRTSRVPRLRVDSGGATDLI